MITSNLNTDDTLLRALDRLGASLDLLAGDVASMIVEASQGLSEAPTDDDQEAEMVRLIARLRSLPPAGGHDDQT